MEHMTCFCCSRRGRLHVFCQLFRSVDFVLPSVSRCSILTSVQIRLGVEKYPLHIFYILTLNRKFCDLVRPRRGAHKKQYFIAKILDPLVTFPLLSLIQTFSLIYRLDGHLGCFLDYRSHNTSWLCWLDLMGIVGKKYWECHSSGLNSRTGCLVLSVECIQFYDWGVRHTQKNSHGCSLCQWKHQYHVAGEKN